MTFRIQGETVKPQIRRETVEWTRPHFKAAGSLYRAVEHITRADPELVMRVEYGNRTGTVNTRALFVLNGTRPVECATWTPREEWTFSTNETQRALSKTAEEL